MAPFHEAITAPAPFVSSFGQLLDSVEFSAATSGERTLAIRRSSSPIDDEVKTDDHVDGDSNRRAGSHHSLPECFQVLLSLTRPSGEVEVAVETDSGRRDDRKDQKCDHHNPRGLRDHESRRRRRPR